MSVKDETLKVLDWRDRVDLARNTDTTAKILENWLRIST